MDLEDADGENENPRQLSVKPQQGMAVVFFPAYLPNIPKKLQEDSVKSGGGDFATGHEAKCVGEGCRKLICQQWILSGQYDYDNMPEGHENSACSDDTI